MERALVPRPSKNRAEAEQVRTRDKVAAIDHAVAPLGTDEEAAGTPVPPHIIAKARRLECKSANQTNQGSPARALAYWILMAVGLISGLIVVATMVRV
jgi:hypothetical protein